MIDANKAKKLLEDNEEYFRARHWFPETYVKADGFHFNIRHQLDGSSISDSYEVLKMLYEVLREEDDEPAIIKPPMTDDELLAAEGYEMICESPLEISSINDQNIFISGFPARIFLDTLREKNRKNC